MLRSIYIWAKTQPLPRHWHGDSGLASAESGPPRTSKISRSPLLSLYARRILVLSFSANQQDSNRGPWCRDNLIHLQNGLPESINQNPKKNPSRFACLHKAHTSQKSDHQDSRTKIPEPRRKLSTPGLLVHQHMSLSFPIPASCSQLDLSPSRCFKTP